MHHEVGASGKVGVAGHEPSVAEEHNIGAGLGWAHKVGATEHRAVVEGDVFAAFQLPIARPWLDPMVDELIHLQLPRLVGLRDAVGVRLHAVVKRGVANGDGIILAQGDLPGMVELYHLQRVANMRRRGVEGDRHKFCNAGRPVDRERITRGAERPTGDETRQPECVVAMHVGDKDPADFIHVDAVAKHLVLGGLAAVEKPEFTTIGSGVDRGRGIAGAGWGAGAGTQKRQAHNSFLMGSVADFCHRYPPTPK